MDTKKDILRNRLRFLYEMGDASVYEDCWRNTDDALIVEYGWILSLTTIAWPKECRA